MATINLGAIKFNWKGAYNSGTSYAVDDVVSSGGNSYVCIQAHSNQAVGNATAYWNIMSSAGTDADLLNIASTAQGDIYYNNGSAIARLGAGTSGHFLKTSGTSANPVWAEAGGGGLASQQVFTSTGTATWTKPTGIKLVKVYVTGGGAGGGAGTGSYNIGGGGGAGGTAIEIIDVSSVSSVTVTVGTAGTGAGANSSTSGGDGATSSFGSYCSATGGTGGKYATGTNSGGGEGGIGTNGQINIKGGWAGMHNANSSSDNGGGGFGGTSFFGGGGRPSNHWSSNDAQLGQAFGSGGGGGSHTDKAGATGKAGIVIVEEYK
jgi:hypothetical protein